MTRVEEAKAALWGQLVDSGELDEDDANVLLGTLVDAAKEEGVSQGVNMALRWGWITSRDAEALLAAARVEELPTSYGDSLPIKLNPLPSNLSYDSKHPVFVHTDTGLAFTGDIVIDNPPTPKEP